MHTHTHTHMHEPLPQFIFISAKTSRGCQSLKALCGQKLNISVTHEITLISELYLHKCYEADSCVK